MRATHFAKFDDELQDSDQTISTAPRCLQPRARLSTVADASRNSSDKTAKPLRRHFQTSAFFSDTTDEDAPQPVSEHSDRSQLSMSAYNNDSAFRASYNRPLHMSAGPRKNRRRSIRQRETCHVPKLCMDAIQFPVTRSVLWDRRRLSDVPVSVSFEQVAPQFCVSTDALKEIYRLYREKSGVRGNGAALCYLYGNATSRRMNKVLLSGVEVKKQDARAAGTWCVPVHPAVDGNNLQCSQESYRSTIVAVQSGYRDEYADNVSSKLQPKLLVVQSSSNDVQLDCQLECIASPVLLKFSLIKNLPLLMTPLAVSLAKREFSTQSGNHLQSGYLTLDRTRKAVPLLKVDPLVLQQPLVGIWVYGVQINDAWDEDIVRQQLAHPLLYFACMSYLMSEAIQERVGPEKHTFLVALYSASDPDDSDMVGSLPRFFECDIPDSISLSSRLLPLELYSSRQSCLAGMSKFLKDVVFTLSAAPTSEWEAAKRHAKIPIITQSKETQVTASPKAREKITSQCFTRFKTSQHSSPSDEDNNDRGDWTSGWTITTDAVRKGADSDSNAHRETSEQRDKETCNVAATIKSGKAKAEENIPTSLTQLDNVNSTQAPEASSTPEDGGVQRTSIDKNNYSSNYRSCCKTQQLLTIQHQQILENQQRQLQEMQEQIIQLRRLLNVARDSSDKATTSFRNDESGHDFVASASDIRTPADVSDVSSPSNRLEQGPMSFHSSLVSTASQRGGTGQFEDDLSVHSHHVDDDVRKADEHDLSLSSLSLSSISCDSANLSSLSSSIVGKQLPNSSQSLPKTTTTNDLQAESCAPDLSQSLSTAVIAAQANNDDNVVEKPSENVSNVSDDAEDCSTGQELSIEELSASSLQEAHKDVDETDAAPENYTEDSDTSANGDENCFIKPLLCPDAYLQQVGGFVDHHGGCFTTPPLDFHSFCVPRIKFLSDAPECDSDDEEIHLIEKKYKRLMAA